MDFSIPSHLQELKQAIHEYIQEELYPLEAEMLAHGWSATEEVLQTKREEVKDRGWWAPQMPKDLGGVGLSLLEFSHISEVLGQSPFGHYVFNCQAPDAGNMEILHEFATPEQQEQYLEPLLAGEIRSCFAMTEPMNAGSNPTKMSTLAIKDGDAYVINGRKWFTTAADGASFTIVMAITDPENENKYQRASLILVPMDTPGFQLVRNISVMGEPGEGYASHAEVSFNNVRVPLENLLGGEGAGFAMAQARLGPGRIHHCMRWLGICERAFALMCQRCAERELSEGKPLGTRQIAQAWIAECRVEINAARLMVLQAAWKIDNEGTYAAREEISLIKFYVAGVLQKVLDCALQLHGALGMTDDTPIAYWYRHERAARIYDGPDEVHKMVVAKRILRNYGM